MRAELAASLSLPPLDLYSLANGSGDLLAPLVELGLVNKIVTGDGEHAFHLALRSHHIELVPALFNAGLDLDAAGWQGMTPTQIAADQGLEDICRRILAQSPEVAQRQPDLSQGLHLAIRGHDTDTLLRLLRNGADPNTVEELTQFTSLMLACAAGNHLAAAHLLRYGAAPQTISKSTCARCLAIEHSTPDIVQLLIWLLPSGVPCRNQKHATPLYLAATRDDPRFCLILLDSGADIDATWNGETALMHAAQFGHTDVIDLLIKRGADPLRVSPSGWTPLHWAVICKKPASIACLLAHGVPTEVQDVRDYRAIDLATQHGHWDLAALLRRAGSRDAYWMPEPSGPTQDSYDFFISYRHRKYTDAAQWLTEQLSARKCNVFLDTASPKLSGVGVDGNTVENDKTTI